MRTRGLVGGSGKAAKRLTVVVAAFVAILKGWRDLLGLLARNSGVVDPNFLCHLLLITDRGMVQHRRRRVSCLEMNIESAVTSTWVVVVVYLYWPPSWHSSTEPTSDIFHDAPIVCFHVGIDANLFLSYQVVVEVSLSWSLVRTRKGVPGLLAGGMMICAHHLYWWGSLSVKPPLPSPLTYLQEYCYIKFYYGWGNFGGIQTDSGGYHSAGDILQPLGNFNGGPLGASDQIFPLIQTMSSWNSAWAGV